MRFLLDEDVAPDVAIIATGRGLDVVSVHELGRTGVGDDGQLRFAASEGRIFVTRNRDDFIRLTRTFFATNQAHAGVLVIPHTIPNNRATTIVEALRAWSTRYGDASPGAGFLDFL